MRSLLCSVGVETPESIPGGFWEHRGGGKKAGRKAVRGQTGLGWTPSRDHRAWENTHALMQAEAPRLSPGSPGAQEPLLAPGPLSTAQAASSQLGSVTRQPPLSPALGR